MNELSGLKVKMTKTFSDYDKFGLEPFARQLTKYLEVESQFVEESFILSLNSEFGSGKTTFFEMWKDLLLSENKFKVIYINAWESDYQGDALLAIISSFLKVFEDNHNKEKAKEVAGRLCKLALSIGNDIVQKATGIDFIKAGQYAENEDGIATKMGHECYKLYNERLELFDKLKSLLRNLANESERPILVIIDELDRCRPNYSIEFLETIKHFFDIKGFIFTIGVDRNQLASSAKALFGQDLCFDEYYRKFAHRNVSLPVKNKSTTESFCRKLAEEYLSNETFQKKKRFSYADHDQYRKDNIVEICIAFSMNARQVHEYFRIAAHVISVTKKPDNSLLWGWHIGIFFMTALSIKEPEIYHKIGQKTFSISELTTFLKTKESLLFNDGNNSSFWWAALLYLGVFSINKIDGMEKEFNTLQVWDSTNKGQNDFVKELSRINTGYDGHRTGINKAVFPQIYEYIEGLRTFET